MAEAFADAHGAQLAASGFPAALYERLRHKLEAEARLAPGSLGKEQETRFGMYAMAEPAAQVFDAGYAFEVQQLPDGTRRAVCIAPDGLAPAKDVYLARRPLYCEPLPPYILTIIRPQVDHAWTFRAADARAQLAAMPPLLQRVAAMAGVRLPSDALGNADSDDGVAGADSASESGSEEEESGDEAAEEGLRPSAWRGECSESALADRVLASAWRLCGHYRLAGATGADAEATWYLLDEFGAALRHSARPTLAVVPFLYAPRGGAQPPQAFSLAWPLRALACGDEATRDILPSVPSGPRRDALLACFFRAPRSLRAARDAAFAAALRRWEARQAEAASGAHPHDASATSAPPLPAPPLPLRVFTDIDWVADHLRRPEFAFVERAADADVLWLKAPADDAAIAALGARPDALVNQFPGEEALVFKHLLPRTAAAAAGALGPDGWLPQTFDAAAELDAMLGAHHRAVAAGETPLWILKPWNLARSMDATVAPSLAAVAAASLTGPKVVQRYVASPALYRGRKFDVRVLVAVRAFAPRMEALTWRTAYVRAANRAYTADAAALGDFQTQFTSMRQGGFEEEAVSVDDLAAEFAAQGRDWAAAEGRMRHMIRSLLLAAGEGPVGAFPRARALYGMDVMFDTALRPKLLEVTFCPGVERPMGSDPLFFDKLFGCLFLGESAGFEAL